MSSNQMQKGSTHMCEGALEALEERQAKKKQEKLEIEWPRTPEGTINNCAIANGDEEKNCQICNGECPDRNMGATVQKTIRFHGPVLQSGDQAIPEDEEIHAAHPNRSGSHATYAEAMRLVGAKHSKKALVELVNWLLLINKQQAEQVWTRDNRIRELELRIANDKALRG